MSLRLSEGTQDKVTKLNSVSLLWIMHSFTNNSFQDKVMAFILDEADVPKATWLESAAHTLFSVRIYYFPVLLCFDLCCTVAHMLFPLPSQGHLIPAHRTAAAFVSCRHLFLACAQTSAIATQFHVGNWLFPRTLLFWCP